MKNLNKIKKLIKFTIFNKNLKKKFYNEYSTN